MKTNDKSSHDFTLEFGVRSKYREPTSNDILKGLVAKVKELVKNQDIMNKSLKCVRSFDILEQNDMTYHMERDPMYDNPPIPRKSAVISEQEDTGTNLPF